MVAAVLGYTLPSRGHQHRIVSGMLLLLLTLAMSLILALDRARSRTITIDQGPMQRLVERLDDTAAPPANSRVGVTP